MRLIAGYTGRRWHHFFSASLNGITKTRRGAVRETSTVMDDGWKRVWAEMTDSELEDRLFTYLWLALNTINPHADRVPNSFRKRNGAENLKVERARIRAEATPIAKSRVRS